MTKNSSVLNSFIIYCYEHPDERFWQALRNWSGFGWIEVSPENRALGMDRRDTFYFKGKDK